MSKSMAAEEAGDREFWYTQNLKKEDTFPLLET